MSVVLFDALTVTAEAAWATAPFAVTPTYSDITQYVRNFQISRGRTAQFDRFQTGKLEIIVTDIDRRFDPDYASGAYAPNVLPRKKMRISTTFSAVTRRHGVFYLDEIEHFDDPANTTAWAKITAYDGFGMLARARLPNDPDNPVGDGETVSARINRLLDYAGWPAADRDIDPDSATMVQLAPNGTSILESIYIAADSDFGQFFIAADGKATYRGHRWQLENNLTPSATLGDGGGAEIPYATLTRSFAARQIYNRAIGSAYEGNATLGFVGPTEIDISDAASIAVYEETAKPLGLVGVNNLNVLRNTLEWIVANYKNPKQRFEAVKLNPRNSAAAIYPTALATDIGTRHTMKRRPPPSGSTTISRDVIVEGLSINCRISKDEAIWEQQFSLSEAPASYWRMGVSAWGSTTVWA